MAEKVRELGTAYDPPQRDAGPEEDAEHDENAEYEEAPLRFFTTPISRLVIWHLLTLGLYAPFWFYWHWSIQKRTRGLPIWPVARAWFAVFHVHALFRTIDRGARAAGIRARWNAGSTATTWIVLVVVPRFIGGFGADELSGWAVQVVLSAMSVWPLATAQNVANLAQQAAMRAQEDDDEGDEEEDSPDESEEDDFEDEPDDEVVARR